MFFLFKFYVERIGTKPILQVHWYFSTYPYIYIIFFKSIYIYISFEYGYRYKYTKNLIIISQRQNKDNSGLKEEGGLP